MVTLDKTHTPLHRMGTGELHTMARSWHEDGMRALGTNDLEGYVQAAGFLAAYNGEIRRRMNRR